MGDNSASTTDIDYSISLGACTTSDYEASTWFSFVANSNIIEVLVNETSISNSIIVVVDDCTPGNESFTYYDCVADGAHGWCNMVIGQTYYVMISSEFGDVGEFNISVQGYDLADDDCVDDGTEQSLIGIGTIPNNYCSSDGTVWYIINSATWSEILVNINGSEVGWGLDDPELISVWLNGCPNNGGINISDDIPEWSCLGTGDILYLEIGNLDPEFGGFGYAVSFSPGNNGNDNCPEALQLINVSCTSSVGGTAIVSECITIDADAVCNPGEPGVWYTFGVDDLVSNFDVTGGDFDLFSGNNCNNLDFVGCSGTNDVLNILNTGETYYVLVYEGGGFTATASVPAPINDLCLFASNAIVPNGSTVANNFCATPDQAYCGGGLTDADYQTVWFDYSILNNGTSIVVDVNGTAPQPIDTDELSIAVYENCNGALASAYDILNGDGFVCGSTQLSLDCLPIGTYFIVVGTSNAGAGDFEIQVTETVEAPINDFCSAAEDAVSTGALTNLCAGGEVDFCGLSANNSHDVWYSYTLQNVPANLSIIIDDDNSNGTAVDQVSLGVYVDCNQTPLDSNDPNFGIACNTLSAEMYFSCLHTPVIYFLVASEHGEEGDFFISIEETEPTIEYEIDNPVELICEDSTLELDAGPGYTGYEWQDQNGNVISITQTVEIASIGTYTVTVDLDGCQGSDEVLVELQTAPVIDFPDFIIVCNEIDGDYPFSLDFDAISINSDNGSWTSIDLDNTILDNISDVSFLGIPEGNYQFEYTTQSAMEPCVEKIDTLTIEVSNCICPNPIQDLELSFCNDLSVFNLNGLLNGPSTQGMWSFINGVEPVTIDQDSLITLTGLFAGSYSFSFELDNIPSQTCPLADTIVFLLEAPINVLFDNFPIVCNMQSPLGQTTLNANDYLLSGAGGWNFSAIPGLDFSDLSNLDFEGIAAGSYTVTFLSDNSTNLCANEVFSMEINVSNCDCPPLQLDLEHIFCNYPFSFDLNSTIISADPGTWQADNGNPAILSIIGSNVDFQSPPNGEYLFTYSLENPVQDCPASETISISLIGPPVVAVKDTVMCNLDLGENDQILNLEELLLAGQGDWYDDTGQIISNPNNIDFSVYAIGETLEYVFISNTAMSPCENLSASAFIEIVDCTCDEPEFLDPPILCNISGSELDLASLLITPLAGTWSLVTQPDGANASLIGTVFQAESMPSGTYEVVFELADQSNESCQFVWPLSFEIVEQLEASLQLESTLCDTISEDFPSDISLSNLIIDGEVNGVWKNEFGEIISGQTALSFNDSLPGNYLFYYTVINEMPCMNLDYPITIIVEDCSEPIIMEPEEPEVEIILAPNIFSPNGDGNNDFFSMAAGEYLIENFRIYDRWGNLVCQLENVEGNTGPQLWDGRIDGAPASNGVYVYQMTLIQNGFSESIVGDLTLVR